MTDNECCICLEPITDVNVAVTECGHKFHTSCLIKCKNGCPLCRKQLDKPETKVFKLNQYQYNDTTRSSATTTTRTLSVATTTRTLSATTTTRPAAESTNDLSPEQLKAFELYRSGQNVFITGPGGAGKSYLIKKIKDDLETREQKHAVCALTGCAAVLLNCCAKTIHSWAGIGIANGTDQDIIDKALRNKKANTNWKTTRTLIIDEVSMMSLKIFDVLNKIGQSSRRNYAQAFGGIQVIFIGDFFQLPPVGKPYEPESSMYCFQSANWFKTFPLQNHVVLKTLFRQRDPVFVKVLQEVRMGVLSEESCAILDARAKAKFESDDPSIIPTKLFPRNADADRVNQTMYARIAEEEHKYPIAKKYNILHYDDDSLPIPPDVMLRCSSLTPDEVEVQLDLHIENAKVCKELMLKKGALVMCLANLDTENGICNGSQGVIVGFERVPLALLKTTNQRVYGNTLEESVECPVVKFLNGITMRIAPRLYQHGDFPKYGVVQYPLRLAWAFTIHKSQGITLDIAEMDLGSNVFASGQSYVGLSRVKTLDGLYLSSFNPRKIKTDPIVLEFYRMIPE